MAISRKERLEVLHLHAGDIARMQYCLLVNGHIVTPLQAVGMWLQLPSDDTELLNILLQHLPSTKMLYANPLTWQAKLVDAGDGSGDAMLVLPDELLMQLGWDEEDTLGVSAGNGQITIKQKN